ncbi:hypothetical protein BIY26_05400 [Brenneria goodwinii]|uniref:Uncharacterized protein n=1 Tax=Brenneria goodwinii TaxID=1109412 RepID=A0AAE8ES49_9GAMM|nr:hypothetical protein AWC36_18160 [Brenneria goodwinii]RLM27940.1 hypothetical protein BIY26_05400 [Brenneria goodwinii]
MQQSVHSLTLYTAIHHQSRCDKYHRGMFYRYAIINAFCQAFPRVLHGGFPLFFILFANDKKLCEAFCVPRFSPSFYAGDCVVLHAVRIDGGKVT